jgi:hypothetical protein
MVRAGRSRLARLAVVGIAAVVALSVGGCYERVIRAKGMGADRYSVQEPYSENTLLDNAIMGPPTQPGKKRIKTSRWDPAPR